MKTVLSSWFALISRFSFASILLVLGGLVIAQQPNKPLVPPAGGQPPGNAPNPNGLPGGVQPGEQARAMSAALIDTSINRGLSFLRQNQNSVGTWGTGTDVGSGGGWVIGHTALAGLTLVECGIPKDDAGLKKALAIVRTGYPKTNSTYEVALALLFLDRMGDPQDKSRIQGLAVRLIAGQTASGGWAYKVPIPSIEQHKQMLLALQKMNTNLGAVSINFRDRPSALGLCIKMSDDIRPRITSKNPTKTPADLSDPDQARAAALAALPVNLRGLPVFRTNDQLIDADPADRGQEPFAGTTDNSNTHFAAIALWAARKHDVPTERALNLLVKRFRTTQGDNGSWAYNYNKSGGPVSMTCVALLASAIGHAVDLGAGPRAEQDPIVIKAFSHLVKHVGAPTGKADGRPAIKDSGGLYYLWALERIAVLYDVSTFDNKDWYQWGAEILISNQQNDGSWKEGGFHGENPIINTSFALLFLKRANLTPDLSKKLIVNSSALTASVAPTPPPQTAPTPPPAPTPTPEPPPPKVELPVTQPVVAIEPAKETPLPTPVPQKSSLLWLWILLAIVGLMGIGLIAFLLLRGKKEEKQPKKKRGGDKKRYRDEEEDDEDEERAERRPTRKVSAKQARKG